MKLITKIKHLIMENNNRQGCRWIEEYRKYLQNHIAEGKKFLKNDVGILEKSDIAQTKSFTRGKHTGFVYALDKFNELSATESIEPCATSSRIAELEKENKKLKVLAIGGMEGWANRQEWRLHSSGRYYYKLDYPSQWPTPHVKEISEMIDWFKTENNI